MDPSSFRRPNPELWRDSSNAAHEVDARLQAEEQTARGAGVTRRVPVWAWAVLAAVVVLLVVVIVR